MAILAEFVLFHLPLPLQLLAMVRLSPKYFLAVENSCQAFPCSNSQFYHIVIRWCVLFKSNYVTSHVWSVLNKFGILSWSFRHREPACWGLWPGKSFQNSGLLGGRFGNQCTSLFSSDENKTCYFSIFESWGCCFQASGFLSRVVEIGRFKRSNFRPVVSVWFTSWFLVHYNTHAPSFWTFHLHLGGSKLTFQDETWGFLFAQGEKMCLDKNHLNTMSFWIAFWIWSSLDMLPPVSKTCSSSELQIKPELQIKSEWITVVRTVILEINHWKQCVETAWRCHCLFSQSIKGFKQKINESLDDTWLFLTNLCWFGEFMMLMQQDFPIFLHFHWSGWFSQNILELPIFRKPKLVD